MDKESSYPLLSKESIMAFGSSKSDRAKAQNELLNEAHKLSRELVISFDNALSLAGELNPATAQRAAQQ